MLKQVKAGFKLIVAGEGNGSYKLTVGQDHTEGYQEEKKKIISFENKLINNFYINLWVTELGIKNFDGDLLKTIVTSQA